MLLFLYIFICIICTHCVCVYFIYLYLFTNAWPILDSEGIDALFGAYFFGKKGILFSHTSEKDAILNHV